MTKTNGSSLRLAAESHQSGLARIECAACRRTKSSPLPNHLSAERLQNVARVLADTDWFRFLVFRIARRRASESKRHPYMPRTQPARLNQRKVEDAHRKRVSTSFLKFNFSCRCSRKQFRDWSGVLLHTMKSRKAPEGHNVTCGSRPSAA